MSTSTRSQTRIKAARGWHEKLAKGEAPAWDDVEIVARLRITDESVVRQILFTDRDALLAHWRDLQKTLAAVDAPAPVPAPAPAPLAPEPVASAPAAPAAAVASPGDPADAGDSGLTGLVAAQVKALTAWLEKARREGRDLQGLGVPDLIRIAQAAPKNVKVFKQFHPGARKNDAELLDVLQRAAHDWASLTTSQPAAEPTTASSTAPTGPTSSAGVQEESPAAAAPERRTGLASTVGFAAFEYTTPESGLQPTPAKIRFSATGDESLEMTWPPPPDDGLVRIFRVITNDTYAPVAPELGELIQATFDSQASDTRGFTTPVRHVAIWVNEGPTEEAARAAQPTLYAAGGCVLPVRHCEVREDEGTVIGQWEAIEGVLRVDVLRVPIEQAAQHQHYNPQYRLKPEFVSRGGFTDHDAVPGEEYEYRVYAVASVSGVAEELSPYVARRVKLQAVVQSVDDLSVHESTEAPNAYDLAWTMPQAGNVEIYRTESPPAAGISQHVLDRATLVRQGLTSDLRLARALSRNGDKGGMKNVPWPKGWSKAYFTPVTVLNDELIRVGKHQILTRANPVSHVRLVERVDEQFLTFAWPEGVTMVKVYQGPSGTEIVNPDAEHAIHELSEEEYRKYGGAHLRHRLPAAGCSVHIVGTSYTRGQPVHSAAVTVQYEGLARFTYDLVPIPQMGRFKRGSETLRQVVVQCDLVLEDVPLVLVHNTHRLPLYLLDGQEVQRRVMSFVPGADMLFTDQIDLGGKHGFVRLFVDAPPHLAHKLAVLDPIVDHLRCG